MSLPPDSLPRTPPRFVPTLTERINLVETAESADKAEDSTAHQTAFGMSGALRTSTAPHQASAEQAARPRATVEPESDRSFAVRMAALLNAHAGARNIAQPLLRAKPLPTDNAITDNPALEHPSERQMFRENSSLDSAQMDLRTEPVTSARHVNEIGDPLDHAGSDSEITDSEAPARSLTVQQASDFEEMLAHRVLQRVDIALEQQLHKAIGAVVQAHSASLLPKLRDEVESVVRRAVNEAVSVELASQSKQIEGSP